MNRDEIVRAFLEAHRNRPPKGYVPTDEEVATGKYTPRLSETPPDKIQTTTWSVPKDYFTKVWKESSRNKFYEYIKRKILEEKETQ